MNIDNNAIRLAIRGKLLSVPGIPGEENRAWENINFKPSNDTPWIREQLLPGDKSLSANSELTGVGIMQYDLFWPVGSGTAAEKIANDIEAAFPPATVLGSLVRIEQCNALPGGRGTTGRVAEASASPWWHVPVQIFYTVFSIT